MIAKLLQKQRALIVAGAISLGMFLVLAVVALFDTTPILGVNRWVKPMKFTLSPAIYVWTLAVFLYFLRGRELAKKVIAYGVIFIMFVETGLIIIQAARGTISHFNVTNAFDGAIFSAMGILIGINTLLIIYLLFLYFQAEIDLPAPIIWGIRLGIVLFLFSSAVGALMSVWLRHSVGVRDGGPGLPFVNWSMRGGDLRVAHFIGLHALQAVPLFAYVLQRHTGKHATLGTAIFALAYLGIFALVLAQALAGKPLLAILY